MDEQNSDVQPNSGSKAGEQIIHERLRRLDYGTNKKMDSGLDSVPVSEADSAKNSLTSNVGNETESVDRHIGNDSERCNSPQSVIASDCDSASALNTEENSVHHIKTVASNPTLDSVCEVNEEINSEDEEDIYSSSMLQDDSIVEYENGVVTESSETKSDCTLENEISLAVTKTVEKESINIKPSHPLPNDNFRPSEALYHDSSLSSHLLTEIEDLLTTTVACSPTYETDINKMDFSSTSKENLVKIITSVLEECNTLHREKRRLESDVDRLQADNSSDIYTHQIEVLEKSLAQAQADICSWQSKVHQAEEQYMSENVRIRSDLTTRLERMTKQYEAANKDKESMVIKYATSEREVIVAKKQKEVIEKKLKEMEREREQLQNKNKMLITERTRLCQTLDTKVQKNNWSQREIERLKEEVSSRDVKIKWAQAKLKSEMDAHKETQGKLDRALMKITKHEEELKSIKDEAEKVVRDTRDNENTRANVLDMQLKEEKARLIMERKANQDKGSAFHKVNSELESLKGRHYTLVEEATSLRSRVANFEAEREETEKLFSSLRSEVTNTRQQVADLNLQLSNSSHLHQQLQREREQLSITQQEVDSLQSINNETEGDLLACRQKEAELLAFTQKLTDKNVQIQSQFSALQSKAQLMEIEHEEMKTELEEIKAQKSKLKNDLTKENQSQAALVENLKKQLASQLEETKQLTTKASDLENEIQVLKRKHNNCLKDMSREMHKLRRRMEVHEDGGSIGGNGSSSGGVLSGRSSQSATPHDTLSQGSRASSNTSLNTIEYQNTNGSTLHSQETLPPLNDPLITQQLLVERIIKLQKAAVKKSEKIEFLEEHVTQLVGELKKKSRIIHHYIMKEEAGALANSASDSSKTPNANSGKTRRKSQAELMKHGGIMASVYGSAPRDGTMTLDLSLEINRKLQAVLEDTLLKNITLKDNLNTLGDEIAKISQQKQHLEPHK